MSSAISLEYLQSLINEPDGIAGIGEDGKLPIEIMPSGFIETYKGIYATPALLITAYPSGSIADYAYVTSTLSFYYWNALLATPGWTNQLITKSNYEALTTPQKAAVPYIVVPTM